MKTLRVSLRVAVLSALLATQPGCVVGTVLGFVNAQTGVMRLVFSAELGRCFEESTDVGEFISCFAQVIGRIQGQAEARAFVAEMEFILDVFGEFLGTDPVVVQVPIGMSNFSGTFDDGLGQMGALDVETGVSCITVRPGQQMCAEEGHELVIFDLPEGVTLPDGQLAGFDIEIEAQTGGTTDVDVKILFALEVVSGDTTLLVPYLPAVTSFADVPVVTIPAGETAVPIEPDLDDVATFSEIEIDLTGDPPGPLCGDGTENGQVQASDALLALKTSVGSEMCPLCLCDVDSSGAVRALDALRILKKSVGQNVELVCTACT